jgi:hypothetical protein
MRKVGDYVLGEDIPEEEFFDWLCALRSGEYRQAQNNLFGYVWVNHKLKPAYCCLGVVCKEVGSIPDEELEGAGLPYELTGYKYGNKDKWYRSITYDFKEKLKRAVNEKNYYKSNYEENKLLNDQIERLEVTLHELNDDYRLTFDEIADVLEAVYIHKVLE